MHRLAGQEGPTTKDVIVSNTDPAPLVAVVNTSVEVVALLEMVLQSEGLRTVSAYVPDLKHDQPDARAFLTQHDPPVVVWDIALPYAENWTFFESVRGSDAAKGRQFVLTTTNKRVLEELVGPPNPRVLVGRPFDLDDVITAVHRALAAARAIP